MLVLSFAFLFGLLGAALFARSASENSLRCRIVRVCAYVAAVVVVGYVVVTLHLRFNFTSSMPRGIYRLVPLQKDGVRRGMLVAACAPHDAATMGRRRGYLSQGTVLRWYGVAAEGRGRWRRR